MNEAPFAGALLDSLNIFQQMWIKRSQTVFLCALSLLRLVRSFSGVELTMMSSQDLLFSLAMEKLPKQFALVYNGLMHPAVLSHYPRKSAVELGLVPAQEVKVRKTIEGDIAMAAFGHGGIVIGGSLAMEAATSVVGVDSMVQKP